MSGIEREMKAHHKAIKRLMPDLRKKMKAYKILERAVRMHERYLQDFTKKRDMLLEQLPKEAVKQIVSNHESEHST